MFRMFGIFGLVFVAVAVIAIAKGGYAVVRWVMFNRRARHCDASVTGVREEWKASSGSNSTGGRYVYYSVLIFQTDDGHEVRTVAGNHSARQEYEVGDGVEVSYDPRNPGHAYTGNGMSVATRAVLELVAGSVALSIALPMLVR